MLVNSRILNINETKEEGRHRLEVNFGRSLRRFFAKLLLRIEENGRMHKRLILGPVKIQGCSKNQRCILKGRR